jgi:splicing factor 3B subunit 3
MNRATNTASTSTSASDLDVLTISSPLEAHKPHTLTHAMVGLDVGFENPCFACLEVDYSTLQLQDEDMAMGNRVTAEFAPAVAVKSLTYYALDLGLNHVVRRWSAPVESTSHRLIPLPSKCAIASIAPRFLIRGLMLTL